MNFRPTRVLSLLVLLLLAGCSHNAHTQYPASGAGYGGEVYSQAELDQMLAPIALYPDSLLSQILMAATYPREVAEAARWSTGNPGLSGAAAVRAVEYMDWDPSVKALVAFPQVLDQMAGDMDWTQALGDAYLIQEPDVADAIQRLRDHAYRAGQLDRMEHVRVIRERDIYVIEPASPRIVYVPYYHPLTVYGDWWWPDYPPHYWAPPRGYRSGVTFYWGSGIAIAPTFFYSRFHWPNRHIVIVDRHHYRPHYSRSGGYERYRDARRWQHDNKHRRGVAYHRGYRGDSHHFRGGGDGRFQQGDSWQRSRDQRDNWQRDRSTRDSSDYGRERDFDRDRQRPGQWDRNRDYRGERQPRQGVERPTDSVNTFPRGQESRDSARGSRPEPAARDNRAPGQWDRPQRQFGGGDQRARPQAPQPQGELAPTPRVSAPGGFRDQRRAADTFRQEQQQRGERSGANRADPRPPATARETPARMERPRPEPRQQYQRQERTWERRAGAPEQRSRAVESPMSPRSAPEPRASQARQAPPREFSPQSSQPRMNRGSESRHSAAGPRSDLRGQHSGARERPAAGSRGQGWGDRQRQ